MRQPSGALAGDGIQIGGFFNATCLAELRLGALESDLSRRNQMKADEGGRRRQTRLANQSLARYFPPMTTTVDAIYEKGKLVLQRPLSLPEKSHVRVTIETADAPADDLLDKTRRNRVLRELDDAEGW